MDHLLIFLILTGVSHYVMTISHNYYLIQQGKTWTEAQSYCRAAGSDLATVQTDDDFIQLQTEAQSKGFSSAAWIGLYRDIDNWRWSLGNEPLGIGRPWLPGEPSTRLEGCAGFSQPGWYDDSCNTTFPFMCFDAMKTDLDRYVYYSNLTGWSAAQKYCRKYHTDLASARNHEEYSAMLGKISGKTWFGLQRDTWKWSDQTNVSNIRWAPEQPDNAGRNDYCGFTNISNGQAYDAACSELMPFFCHSVIGKQIMRVKIQSNQDVNNPAVKAALIEQIKQKLKDHGMDENIVVKWREQPGGLVFRKMNNNNTVIL